MPLEIRQEDSEHQENEGSPVNCSESELSIFLQALAEGYLPTCSSDIDQFVPLRSMNIASRSYQRDKKTVVFHGFQSLTMSLNSMEGHGEDLSMSSLEDSLAKTYPSQGKGPESKVIDQGCGAKWRESFAKLIPSTRSWKTAQHSLFEDLELSLGIWPRWGSMRNGECFHAEMSAAFTYGSESGLSLPTTGANEWKGSQKKRYSGSPDFRGAKMSEGLRTCESDPIYLNPSFAELVMMFPSGWSDLRPLEMRKFHEWQQQHSIY